MNYLSSERSKQEQVLNTSVYSVISQEKELENDKARIRRKFFLDKISLKNNNMNKTNYEPDDISLLLNNSMPIEDKMLSFNNKSSIINNKQNENQEESLMRNDSKENNNDSSFTAKLEENAFMNTKGKIIFESDKILQNIDNDDDDYYNLVSSHRYEDGSLKGNTITNKIVYTSNSGNDNNNLNNNNSFHSMNYAIPQIANQLHLQNKHFFKKGQTYTMDKQITFKNHPNVTIRNLFCNTRPIDHTSVNGFDGEHFIIDNNNNANTPSCNSNYQVSIKENGSTGMGFKFINDIKVKNDKIKSISLKKLLTLNKNAFFNLFLYIYDNYYNLLMTHPFIEKKLSYILNDKYSYIIERFRNKYGTFLDIENYELGINELKHKTIFKPSNTFSLYITAKILHWSYIKELQFKKINNISYEIAYHYDTNENISQRKFIDYYKFDIHNSNTFPLWFCSESEEFKHKVKRVLTSTSVQIFSWNDSIRIKINLIQNNGVLVNNVEWMPIKLEIPPEGLYEKNMSKNEMYFDYLRYCEMENVVCLWKSENDYIRNNQLLIKIKKIFEKHFVIIDVKYEILKLLFIKVKMKANKIGILDNELFIKCKLQIVDKEYSICNEITPMICINSLSNNNDIPFQIRKDTIVFLYLTDIIEE